MAAIQLPNPAALDLDRLHSLEFKQPSSTATALSTPDSTAPSSPSLSASPPPAPSSFDPYPLALSISDLNPSVTTLQTSPYPFPANLTNTTTFTRQTHLLTHALTLLTPVDAAYALNPTYLSTFSFPLVFDALRTLLEHEGLAWERTEYHVVVFRSVLHPGADKELLGELDRKAHEEASQSGGLLRYWFGACDEGRRNLATCIWRHRSDATAGGKGPWHTKCRAAARHMYESIKFSSYRLVVDEGVRSWWLEDL